MITEFCYILCRQRATRQRLHITARRRLQSINWAALPRQLVPYNSDGEYNDGNVDHADDDDDDGK